MNFLARAVIPSLEEWDVGACHSVVRHVVSGDAAYLVMQDAHKFAARRALRGTNTRADESGGTSRDVDKIHPEATYPVVGAVMLDVVDDTVRTVALAAAQTSVLTTRLIPTGNELVIGSFVNPSL